MQLDSGDDGTGEKGSQCDSSIEASKQERCAVNCHRSSYEVVAAAVAVAVAVGYGVVVVVAVQVLLSSGIVVRV